MLFKGLGVAIVTPFTEDGVDLEKLKELVEWHIASGTKALIVLGTTGENATMTEDEKMLVFKTVSDLAAGRIVLIANTGDNCTADSIERSLKIKGYGYDGLLLVVPYYNKPQQRGIVAHFNKIVDTVKMPAILYNVPGRCSLNMEVESILECAKNPLIVGVKEASHNDEQIKKIIKNAPEGFGVYCGNDDQNQDCLEWGAHGIISVTGNVVPAQLNQQCEFALNNQFEQANNIHQHLLPLHKALFIETNPAGVKAALNAMGKNVGIPRLPLVEMEENNHQQLTEVLIQQNLVEAK